MSKFFHVFFASLVGAGVGQIIRGRLLPRERRHLGSMALEAFTVALAFASAQVVFLLPTLKDGWPRMAAMAVVIALIWFPGSWLADRLRKKRNQPTIPGSPGP